MQSRSRSRFASLALAAASLTHAAPLHAQNRFSVTESYDPASVLAPGIGASDMVVVNSSMVPSGSVEWDAAALGLPLTANVDAFSVGLDIFPASGPAITPPPANCNAGGFVEAQFTLDPSSEGPPGGPIHGESTGNGAASDTFAARWSGSSVPALRLESDALGIDPATDLDALAWAERRRYPVYFSVDVSTATTLGLDPASVYLSFGDGAFVELFSSADLGLAPGDDLDGLAVGAHAGVPLSPVGRVVFSLSRSSPSVALGAVLESVTAAGLAVATAGIPDPWAFPSNLGTLPTIDNINGVRITDPIWESLGDGSQPDPLTGHPYDTLRFENSGGNVARYVDLELNQAFQLTIQPLGGPGDVWLVFAGLGVPTCAFPFDAPELMSPMALHPAFSIASAVGVGPAQVPLLYTQPLDLAVQGLVIDPGGTVHTTNLATARVH